MPAADARESRANAVVRPRPDDRQRQLGGTPAIRSSDALVRQQPADEERAAVARHRRVRREASGVHAAADDARARVVRVAETARLYSLRCRWPWNQRRSRRRPTRPSRRRRDRSRTPAAPQAAPAPRPRCSRARAADGSAPRRPRSQLAQDRQAEGVGPLPAHVPRRPSIRTRRPPCHSSRAASPKVTSVVGTSLRHVPRQLEGVALGAAHQPRRGRRAPAPRAARADGGRWRSRGRHLERLHGKTPRHTGELRQPRLQPRPQHRAERRRPQSPGSSRRHRARRRRPPEERPHQSARRQRRRQERGRAQCTTPQRSAHGHRAARQRTGVVFCSRASAPRTLLGRLTRSVAITMPAAAPCSAEHAARGATSARSPTRPSAMLVSASRRSWPKQKSV